MAEKHFTEQRLHAENYLIPFFQRHCPGFDRFRILEIGCAEGGFLDALSNHPAETVGLELSPARVALAKSINPGLNIIPGDITDTGIIKALNGRFDLIVLRDVIEHIFNKQAAFTHISRLLKKNGFIYVSFPPRFSPFGGHHQNGRSVLRVVPYIHLLPPFLIRCLGKALGEHPHIVENAITLNRHGLSIDDFERWCEAFGFRFVRKELFIFRPVYQTRFGLAPRRIPDMPLLRELITLGYECLLTG